jgi:hypothetical protein
MATADVFEKETQDCIIDQIHAQHGRYFANTTVEDIILNVDNDDNWELMLLTRYKEGRNYSRSYVILKDGELTNTVLSIEDGAMRKSLDLSSCL